MADSILEFLGLRKKPKPVGTNVSNPVVSSTEPPPTPEWIQREQENKNSTDAYALKDTLEKGLPSDTPATNEALSNEGTGKSVFTMQAEIGNLSGKIIDSAAIQEQNILNKEAEMRVKQVNRIDAASAASSSPSPLPSDIQTRSQLPHP